MDKKEEEKNSSEKETNNEKKKGKRVRINNTKKDQITKKYYCKYCEKNYLSNSALITHLKIKHNYELNGDDDTGRLGRPTIASKSKEDTLLAFNKFITFFEAEKNQNGKGRLLDNNEKDKGIKLDDIKQFIKEAFELYKNYLFSNYQKVEDYPLYKLAKDNWEKLTPKINFKSYYDNTKNMKKTESNSPCVDELFYLYLKEFSAKTNKDYFKLMVKFVVLFREYINDFKKEMVTKDIIEEDKKEYTQLFNGREISELSNDFLIVFMESNNYIGLDKEEITELIQHFCFWLYDSGYSESHLIKLNN
jgi:hypothetical protein